MKKKIIILLMGILIIFSVVLGLILLQKKNSELMSYKNFLEAVQREEVSQVAFKNDEELIVTLIDQATYIVPNPNKEDFKEFLLLNNIVVESKKPNQTQGALSSIILLGGIIGVIIFQRRERGAKKEMIVNVNKNRTSSEKVILFENIAGNDQAKEMAKDIVGFLMHPEKYEKTGARMPRGVLLYGLPGTGKTLMAQAIAGEANVPFYAMSGSDFVQMYVGVGANRVRQLFKKARQSQKAVIFIDEIDALGKSRSGQAGGANDEREQTLNALLTEMSGFHTSEGIVVIGATNRVDTLDAALLRPGRFDRHIEVSLPEKIAREKILDLFVKNKPLSQDVDLAQLANKTARFSGAMLENLVNEAAILAANEDAEMITQSHLNTALYQVIAGMEKKQSDENNVNEEIKLTAYHEAGHALVTRLLLPDVEIARITIIPTTKGAAGYNFNITKDKMYQTKKEILSQIQVLLAGRIAEEIVYGTENITTGAVNDLKEASKSLYDYFSKFGMDEKQGLFFLEEMNKNDGEIFIKCQEKMQELYIETKKLLLEKKYTLDGIVELLLEKESIHGSEIVLLYEGIQGNQIVS